MISLSDIMQLILLHQNNSSFSNLVSFAALKSPKTIITSGYLFHNCR